jgi:hypothetical protein
MRGRRSALVFALALAASEVGCDGCGDDGVRSTSPPTSNASVPTPVASAPPSEVVLDFIDRLPSCDLDHRGLLIDMGTDATNGRFGWWGTEPSSIERVEHHGSSWARVSDRKLELSFLLPEPRSIFVAARAVGRVSKSAQVLLDGQPLGTLRFERDDLRIASTGTTNLPVDAGLHMLTIRFSGRQPADHDAFAELDWVRIGVPDDSPMTYGAPTLHDAIDLAAALSGVPHRALALRTPGEVRCALRVPPRAELRMSIGVRGPGEALAEARILRDGKPPEVVRAVRATGGDTAEWTEVTVPLDRFAGELVAVGLRAVDGAPGARVLFGDPTIVVAAAAPPRTKPAQAAIVVVVDGVRRQDLAPWGSGAQATTPNLARLAATATVFDNHRAPSSIVPTVMASLLTALPPRAHALADSYARLPAAQTTLARIARDASVRSAMFTGVPTTFRAFGFDSAWARFVQHAPSSGEPATAPLDDATSWVKEVLSDAPKASLLSVVHARGGHPPWDVTAKELGELIPADYAGPIDPRRAAQAIATLRDKRVGGLGPPDHERIVRLAAIGLQGQDRSVGALIEALKTSGYWEETLFIVTGDVGTGAASPLPYGDGLDLAEDALTLPLLVHFPGSALAGARVEAPTEIYDVARTVALALGLALPKEARGRDLASVAGGLAEAQARPQVAALGELYSARLGPLILSGKAGKPPSMCDLALDPTCAFNRRVTLPLATQSIFRAVVELGALATAPLVAREPATFDTDTVATLRVWGAQE